MLGDRGYTKIVSDDVIELNGKRYDAITGAFLGKSHVKPVPAPLQARVIDGFIRPSHSAATAPHSKKQTANVTPKPTTHPTVAHPDIKRAPKHIPKEISHPPQLPHTGTKPVHPHKPQHAQTLMRRTVHKPNVAIKPAIKAQAPAEMIAKPASAMVRHKHSVTQVNPSREERAKHVSRHQAVARFHAKGQHSGVSTTAALHSSTESHIPVITVKPAPAPHSPKPAAPAAHAKPDIFEAAMSHATSHEHPAPKKYRNRRRLINTLAIVAAFFVIGGFVTYLSLPSLELRIASVQAGFHVAKPSYTPTGYALEGGVHRNGGTISMRFRSGDSHFVITQQASDWNSQTLLDNTLALSGPHQTIQRNGQTIYVYGNGANASWVNGEVRYDISGNAQLSDDEIATMATSL
jgi:hypothetical protein